MKLVGNTVLASVIVLALSSVAKADLQVLTLKPGTYQKLMPFFDRLASAQIILVCLGGCNHRHICNNLLPYTEEKIIIN